jgi:hypothetical protein
VIADVKRRIAFNTGVELFVLGLMACWDDGVAAVTENDASPVGVAYPIVVPDAVVDAGATRHEPKTAGCVTPARETGGERQFGAPRHTCDGHTGHYSDRALVAWVLDGVPAGGVTLPFRDRLSGADIASRIVYIKSMWPAEVQERQAQMSQAWEDQVGGG